MTSTLPANRVWEEAESLIIQLDRVARTSDSFAATYQQIAGEVSTWLGASRVGIWATNHTGNVCCAAVGQTQFCLAAANELALQKQGFNATSFWKPSDQLLDKTRVAGPIHAVTQPILPGMVIQLVVEWTSDDDAHAWDSSRRAMIAEVTLAIVEICATTYMREQLSNARQAAAALTDREHSLVSLYQGVDVPEAFHRVAKSLAAHRSADRVSVLQVYKRRCELMATSSSQMVDRRSRLASHQEALAEAIKSIQSPISLSVGHPAGSAKWCALVDRYVVESGCRHVELECVPSASNPRANVAVVITEWFDSSPRACEPRFREHAEHAIQQALANQSLAWPILLRQLSRKLRSKSFGLVSGFAFVATLLLTFLPVTFMLPVEGQVLPVQHRRIYAHSDAVVTSILVTNGQVVNQGSNLFKLRSASLDLREEQLRGELLTAKTRLASLTVSRSSGSSDEANSLSQSLSISANEQTLKTEVAGLEKQLKLVESQKQTLVIQSPLTGIVDRWDLEQSLANRPVTQGQHLVDIYASQGDWHVELELPDQYASYLSLDSNAQKVNFRLQAQPNREYQATVTSIARSTQLNAQGQPFVRVNCLFARGPSDSLAIGATVWAELECGKQPLGFVWFRGLFEWFERQTWY
jgi:multidrug efflux pump subunit AcrA (membrane-fusion protein)